MNKQELLSKIEKLEKGINSKATPSNLLPTLKAQKDKFEQELAKLKEPTKKAVKKPKRESKTLDKVKSMVKVKSTKLGKIRDEDRKALPSGKRVSASGNVYYENRSNRVDSQTSKKPYLAKGGYMDKGGYVAISEKDGYWYIMSKPTTKELAEELISLGVPRGEEGKVVSIKEAKEHNKVIGKEYLADGGKVKEIDMDEVESSAKFYTDESKWSIKPTISKFEEEIKEYETIKNKLDNKETTPSKIIGTGYKSQYARPLAYRWLNERILIAKRAIEILKERGEKMAKGGEITFYDKETSYKLGRPSSYIQKDVISRVNIQEEDFAGNFGWEKSKGKLSEGYLYQLDKSDKDFVSEVKLKDGEKIFRYITYTTSVGGMKPLIKINIDKGLLYFLVDSNKEEVKFENVGVKALWVNLITEKMAKGGETNNIPKYRVDIYEIGDEYDRQYSKYVDSLDEAKILARRGNQADIYDNEEKKYIQYAKGGSLTNEEYDKLTRDYDKLTALHEDAIGEDKKEYAIQIEKLAKKIHKEERGYKEGGYMEDGGYVNRHTYMMLGRLQSDNEYFLGYGNRNPKQLWAGNVDDQIEEMKKLWNELPEYGKPEWLSMEDIEEYERQMKDNTMAKGGEVETILFGVKKGDQDWEEVVITTNPNKIEDAKKWAKENGFDRLRVSNIDMEKTPDFTKTFAKGGEVPSHFGSGKNINVFGYETMHFDICGKAVQEFESAIIKLENASELEKEALSKCAMYVDDIFMEEKLVVENNYASSGNLNNVISLGMTAMVYNYKGGMSVNLFSFLPMHIEVVAKRLDQKMARGGMVAGRWYKDNDGKEFRFVGESNGKLLFKDGEKIVEKEEDDFEDRPKESKFFGLFEKGGDTNFNASEFRELVDESVSTLWKGYNKLEQSVRYLQNTGQNGLVGSFKQKVGMSNLEDAINELDSASMKFEKGGYMEDGGITEKEVVKSNANMVLSQIKAVKHHADELSNVVSKNSEIEAWVVGKIERASTDLSDITHYLEGQKETMAKGGMIKYQGKKGKIVSKKGDMYFVEIENFHPNGDTFRSVLREGEFEKLAKGGEIEKIGYENIITDKNGNKYAIKNWDAQGYIIPYDGSKYWEHFKVPKENWIKIQDIDWSKFNMSKSDFYNQLDESNKRKTEILDKYKSSFAKGGKLKFEVDDVVYNKTHNTIGIVRMGEEKGEVKTDADGNVNAKDLEYYNPMKHESHKNAQIAPSTQKEIESRGLWKPFSTRTSKLGMGGKVTFDEKLKAVEKSLLKRKKVSPKVQKDYGKTYNKKEAKESALRIVGAMVKKEKMEKGGLVSGQPKFKKLQELEDKIRHSRNRARNFMDWNEGSIGSNYRSKWNKMVKKLRGWDDDASIEQKIENTKPEWVKYCQEIGSVEDYSFGDVIA